jgi:hypothetical protein
VREGRRGGGVLGRVGRKDWAGGKIRRGEEEVGQAGWGRVRSLFCFSFFSNPFQTKFSNIFLNQFFTQISPTIFKGFSQTLFINFSNIF